MVIIAKEVGFLHHLATCLKKKIKKKNLKKKKKKIYVSLFLINIYKGIQTSASTTTLAQTNYSQTEQAQKNQ